MVLIQLDFEPRVAVLQIRSFKLIKTLRATKPIAPSFAVHSSQKTVSTTSKCLISAAVVDADVQTASVESRPTATRRRLTLSASIS